jgi:hypothetical protein
MKGDFSRDTFNLKKNFSRVLIQQGRVQLDADFNEQSSILLHYLRTLARDIIGPYAGPEEGFTIDFLRDENDNIIKDNAGNPKDLAIAEGRYYVEGILCENDALFNNKPVSYFNQPGYPLEEDKLPEFPYLVYLDVWERHITRYEDEVLREVALGEVDTTTRAQVVWQVKLRALKENEDPANACGDITFPPPGNARLIARTEPSEISDDPCSIEPDAGYRGMENQLYRVEIHTGNVDEHGTEVPESTPTFKWSRENGAVVFAIIDAALSNGTTKVTLASLGHDDKLGLLEGDWVEIVDDGYTLHNRAGNLLQIESIDRDEMSVTLNGTPNYKLSEPPGNHLLLRRWDQKAGNPQEGGLTLNTEGNDADNAAEIIEDQWLKLENGIQIKFPKNDSEATVYRTGDYWLIPARTATGDVEWSKDDSGDALAQLTNGVAHYYAPLGVVTGTEALTSCRCNFTAINDCVRYFYTLDTRIESAQPTKPTKPMKETVKETVKETAKEAVKEAAKEAEMDKVTKAETDKAAETVKETEAAKPKTKKSPT